MRNNTLRQSLCEYCTNVELKVKEVNNIAARINNSCRIRHNYHAVDLITCGRTNGNWLLNCANQKCEACGTDGFDRHLAPLLDHQGPVSWKRWEYTVTEAGGKKVGIYC